MLVSNYYSAMCETFVVFMSIQGENSGQSLSRPQLNMSSYVRKYQPIIDLYRANLKVRNCRLVVRYARPVRPEACGQAASIRAQCRQ